MTERPTEHEPAGKPPGRDPRDVKDRRDTRMIGLIFAAMIAALSVAFFGDFANGGGPAMLVVGIATVGVAAAVTWLSITATRLP